VRLAGRIDVCRILREAARYWYDALTEVEFETEKSATSRPLALKETGAVPTVSPPRFGKRRGAGAVSGQDSAGLSAGPEFWP
jgi:hypothetical protein